MADSYDDYKKRPPPIAIPAWPQPRPTPGPNAFANNIQARSNEQQQQQQQQDTSNFASVHVQPTARSVTSPLTSPPEQNVSRSVSHASKGRTSAIITLSYLMDQARVSPRKSDQSSSMPSRRGTSHSRHSEASHRSATAAQARLEALDQDTTVTTRAQIESRSERKLFKMTGQIPPTPITGTVDTDSVFIRSQDLRAQCRVASSEKKIEREDVTRSPKKKLFGVSLPTFSRTSASTPTPEMPSKAARVLGTTPSRKPRRIEVRPIRPASPKTPKRVPRSDTSRSLPAKVYERRQYNRHHNSPGKRRATARKTSIGKSPNKSVCASPSNDSTAPPTPPAKDTPPRAAPIVNLVANPPSPLRRAPVSHNLRESYGDVTDKSLQVQLPKFALSPSPQKTVVGVESPAKYLPYTVEDYTRLIQGDPMQWPYPEKNELSNFSEQNGNQSMPLDLEGQDHLKFPRPDRWSEDDVYNAGGNCSSNLLPPRFYSPSNRSVRLFKEGESPSTNTDAGRMVFTLPPDQQSLHRGESSSGTIDMIFQGSASEIDPNSSTADLIKSAIQSSPLQSRDEHAMPNRAMQDLRFDERQRPPPTQAKTGHLQPGPSSSMLTNAMNGSSPGTAGTAGTFRPYCPGAIPSPLYKNDSTPVPTQSLMCSPPPMMPNVMGLWSSPPSKSIDDHFYMTNEHLDVVGKTTYDILATFSKDMMTTMKSGHDHISGLVERSVEELKSEVEHIGKKADDGTHRDREIGAKLDQLLDCIKGEVFDALNEQGKKAAELGMTVDELRKTVEALQQSIERLNNQSYPVPAPAPSLGGYYGNGSGREGQAPPVPLMQENVNVTNTHDAYNDTRGMGYGSGYGQGGHRGGYHGRSTREERSPYLGTNPYHFSNGGQYKSGYMGGYSYNMSPGSGEQQHTFGQKTMQ